jgi:DNA-binding response OmpR family regulator
MSQLILVAEDEENFAAMLEYRLNKMGYEVVVVSNGREALDATLELQPALCLFDVSMPELDGLDALRSLRSNPETSELPVILLSGHDSREAVGEAYRAGADDYLVKPVDPADLVERIQSQLGADGT